MSAPVNTALLSLSCTNGHAQARHVMPCALSLVQPIRLSTDCYIQKLLTTAPAPAEPTISETFERIGREIKIDDAKIMAMVDARYDAPAPADPECKHLQDYHRRLLIFPIRCRA
jgi:hypothetical protein